MNVSFTTLNLVLAIARSGNFSKAAEELHLTQPALSRRIALIEDHYGFRIFDRGRHGARLTAVGSRFVEEAAVLVRNARAFDHNMKQCSAGLSGPLHLGVGPIVASMLLPELTSRILADYAKVDVKILIQPMETLIRALLDDEIDAFICPASGEEIPPEITAYQLGTVSADFIVQSGHDLAAETDMSLDKVLEFPLACSVDVEWARNRKGASGSFVCENFHVIRELVLRSNVVGILPTSFVGPELAAGSVIKLHVDDSPFSEQSSQYFQNPILFGRSRIKTPSKVALNAENIANGIFSNL